MGGYPLYGSNCGGVTGPVGVTIDGAATSAAAIREVGIHLGGGGKGRGGI